MNDPYKIVIAENHRDLAETLSAYLDAEGDFACVGIAASSDELARLAGTHGPHAYVIDLSLDDGSSVPLIRKLRADHPEAAIVVHSGLGDDAVAAACRRAGCDALVTKGGPVEDLVIALRQSITRRLGADR